MATRVCLGGCGAYVEDASYCPNCRRERNKAKPSAKAYRDRDYRKARRETSAAIVDLVEQAIDEGSFRPVDPETAAFGLIGAANWVAFWYPRPSGAGAGAACRSRRWPPTTSRATSSVPGARR